MTSETCAIIFVAMYKNNQVNHEIMRIMVQTILFLISGRQKPIFIHESTGPEV
jgi:hypothetical protein